MELSEALETGLYYERLMIGIYELQMNIVQDAETKRLLERILAEEYKHKKWMEEIIQKQTGKAPEKEQKPSPGIKVEGADLKELIHSDLELESKAELLYMQAIDLEGLDEGTRKTLGVIAAETKEHANAFRHLEGLVSKK